MSPKVILAAVALCLAFPALAAATVSIGGTPPTVVSVAPLGSAASVTWAGYDLGATYTLQVSGTTAIDQTGAPSQLVASAPASIATAGGSVTSIVPAALTPGTYYVRIVDDYTSLWLSASQRVCAQFGCTVTWDGKPRVTASSFFPFTVAQPASVVDVAIPAQWKNCKAVNKRYPHGVGRVGAHDKTTGDPVTNFKRSNSLYATAMKFNRGLDRDKDGIACEKA